MEPIRFPECNATYAKDQPEYESLPALQLAERGQVITCWRLTFKERLKVLFGNKIWLSLLTFHNPLQPVIISLDKPFETRPLK